MPIDDVLLSPFHEAAAELDEEGERKRRETERKAKAVSSDWSTVNRRKGACVMYCLCVGFQLFWHPDKNKIKESERDAMRIIHGRVAERALEELVILPHKKKAERKTKHDDEA